MRTRNTFLRACAAGLLLLACSPGVEEGLEVRVELLEPESGAQVFSYEREKVVLSAPERFALDSVLPALDAQGRPAVRFSVSAPDRRRFELWTEEHLGRRVAFLAGGEVVMLADLDEPMPGGGVLSGGGSHGFTQAEVRRIVLLLRDEGDAETNGSGGSPRVSVDELKRRVGEEENAEFERFPLHAAAKRNRLDEAASLLDEAADVNGRTDRQQLTALMVAAKYGHIEMVRLLVERGAEVDATEPGGFTALMLASFRGYREIAVTLLENGADMNVALEDGRTPLFAAVAKGAEDLVLLLVDRGADLQHEDARGWTALHHAAQLGHLAIVRLLLEQGADGDARTHKNRSPLDLAGWDGHAEVEALLREYGAE
jgi:hypothetical protein